MKNDNLSDFLTDIANAIREKTGTTNLINALNFSLEIRNISSEPSIQTAPFKDVNFYDYNGDILYSYTWDEFIEYNQLPPLPTIHEQKGLICYMWNYTLEEILEQGGRCDVGAMYETADSYTHIFLTPDYVSGKTVTLNGFDADIVDWGDGNAEEYKEGITHTYDLIGRAEIVIIGDGLAYVPGNNAPSYIISKDVEEVWYGPYSSTYSGGIKYFWSNQYSECYAKYMTMPKRTTADAMGGGTLFAPNIRHINLIANNGRYGFHLLCPKLETISFNAMASVPVNEYSFYNSPSLKRFHFPTNTTFANLDYNTPPSDCPIRSLIEISVSAANESLTALNNILVLKSSIREALLMCKSSYILPTSSLLSTITNIRPGACSGMFNKVLYMRSTNLAYPYMFLGSNYITLDCRECTSVKTLVGPTCLEGCSNLKIVVPDSLYDQWIIATNWVNFADNIIKASEYSE